MDFKNIQALICALSAAHGFSELHLGQSMNLPQRTPVMFAVEPLGVLKLEYLDPQSM